MTMHNPVKIITLLLAAATTLALAQVETQVPDLVPGARPVHMELVRIHGVALQGNLEGNDATRDTLVFLPPGYSDEPQRRYPVVYALHGYSIGAEQWSEELHAAQTIAGAFALGVPEMIVVLPDSKTAHNGSMYSASVTTGDFERFVAEDLVAYIDEHYRSIPERRFRGLVGHSMGGYGATRIGMKRADVFGSLYIMSPCCLSARTSEAGTTLEEATASLNSPAESASLGFFPRAQLAVASAWSPNPEKPPLYVDLPTANGELQPEILAKWAANAPLAFVDQYIGNLRLYKGIAIDVGDQDGLRVDAGTLHDTLNSYGIDNSFEIYPGTHTSAVALRFQDHVLPFFGRNLGEQE